MSTLTLKKDSTTTATYSYTYDSLGNILTVSKNGSLIYAYEYDSLDQLTREDDVAQSTSTLFDYDLSGNITARHIFPYWAGCPTSQLRTLIGIDQYCTTISYGYSAGTWGDMLTSYNGTTISYDAIGNPTNWRNGITNLTWNGRELNSFVKGSYTHSFEYNADGIRTQKTNWYTGTSMAEIYHYVLDGTKIVSEYRTYASDPTPGNVKYYYYDAAGSIAGFEYNGTTYYFQKNLQGDIIRICNIAGNTVVEYTYDAWGKVTSMTGTLASTVGQANPFRYRGYYYDTETGLYYLQTRYYDPEVGRFLNADGYIGANGDIIGYNMYAYCSNNPVIRIDPNGDLWWIIPLIIIIPLTVTGCTDSSSDPEPIVEVKPAPTVEIKPMPKCPTEVIELLIESNKKKIVELNYEGHITEDGFDVYFFYDKPFNLRFRYAVYVKTHNETYKEYYKGIARNYTTMSGIFSYINSGTFSTGIPLVDGIIGIADLIGHFGGQYFDGKASEYYHLSYNASNRIRITIDHIICYFMADDKVLNSWYD